MEKFNIWQTTSNINKFDWTEAQKTEHCHPHSYSVQLSVLLPVVFHVFIQEMILPIFEGLRWVLFLFIKWPARLNTHSEGTYNAGMTRYFLAKMLNLG